MMTSATTTVDEGNYKTTTVAETVLGWKCIFGGSGTISALNTAPNIIRMSADDCGSVFTSSCCVF